jgi:hypothetical protein
MAADRAAKKEHGCHQGHALRRLSPQAKASQLSPRKSGTRSVRCPCLGWPLSGIRRSGRVRSGPSVSEHPDHCPSQPKRNQPCPTARNQRQPATGRNQGITGAQVAFGRPRFGPGALKIRVSVVRFRPWPPFKSAACTDYGIARTAPGPQLGIFAWLVTTFEFRRIEGAAVHS